LKWTTDTEDAIMTAGISLLNEKLGAIETEIFISAISASKANYTEWRRDNLYKALFRRSIEKGTAPLSNDSRFCKYRNTYFYWAFVFCKGTKRIGGIVYVDDLVNFSSVIADSCVRFIRMVE